MTTPDKSTPAPTPEKAPDTPATVTPAPENSAPKPATEVGGRKGPEPTRYGDWEKKGIAVDF